MRGRAGEYEIIADGLSRQVQVGLATGRRLDALWLV
jgi:hypothetical protein